MDRKTRIARWLITIPILMFGLIPIVVDMTETHVFHPDWPPHARLHTVWLIAMKSCLAIVSVYLMWFGKWDTTRISIAGAIGICVTGSFWIAGITHSLYGGGFGDSDGVPGVAGLDTNLVVFALEFVSLSVGLVLIEGGGDDCAGRSFLVRSRR